MSYNLQVMSVSASTVAPDASGLRGFLSRLLVFPWQSHSSLGTVFGDLQNISNNAHPGNTRVCIACMQLQAASKNLQET